MGTNTTRSEAPASLAVEAMPGAMTPTELVAAVIDGLGASAFLAESSFEVLSDVMSKFGRYCERGVGVLDVNLIQKQHAEAFIHSLRPDASEPSVATMHLRRGAIRLLCKEGRRLDLLSGDPTIDILLPPRSVLSTRPLTDDEIELCRLAAVFNSTDLRSAVAWALAECTARVSEIAHVSVRDVDMSGHRVYIAGSGRTDPRWAPMPPWAETQLARRLSAGTLRSDPDARLVPWPSRNRTRPTNAATMTVIGVLRRAGIHGEPDVRPGSVAGWAGGRLLRRGYGIDEVAKALGSRSLDRAAQTIGFDWRGEHGDVEP